MEAKQSVIALNEGKKKRKGHFAPESRQITQRRARFQPFSKCVTSMKFCLTGCDSIRARMIDGNLGDRIEASYEETTSKGQAPQSHQFRR